MGAALLRLWSGYGWFVLVALGPISSGFRGQSLGLGWSGRAGSLGIFAIGHAPRGVGTRVAMSYKAAFEVNRGSEVPRRELAPPACFVFISS